MTPDEQSFLRRFFRAVTDRPIEFDGRDERHYVAIYADPNFEEHDPVKLLMRSIQYSTGQSVQLLSGFRGSGKSTELRRLRSKLNGSGVYKVVLIDVEDYLSPSKPIGVSDFLMALAGGLGDALLEAGYLMGDPAHEGYWSRLVNFLTRTNIELSSDLSVGASANLKATLKSDPSFREKLQMRMGGHLGALTRDVRAYVGECVKKLKNLYGPDTEMVLLVDSMEHIRGTSTDAVAVQDSIINLFVQHSDELRFDYLHVVYTVPPYLQVLQPNLGSLYQPGGLQMIPTLKVRLKNSLEPFQPALDLLERLISERGDWMRLLGPESRGTLGALSLLSGGELRSFLRLFAEIIRRADRLPVSRPLVDAAIQQCRAEFLPLADEDAVWLDQIASSHGIALQSIAQVQKLARYVESQLVLNYRNGEDWYDIHPLVRDVVRQQAEVARKRWVTDVGGTVESSQEESSSIQGLAEGTRLSVLRIGSFRLLREAELYLEPSLAVVVGPNQSGKSSLLDALQLLSDAARGNLVDAIVRCRGGFSTILSRGAEEPAVRLEVELRAPLGQTLRYSLRLGPVGAHDFAVVQEELAERTQDDRWMPVLSRAGMQAKLFATSITVPNGREALLPQLGSMTHPIVQQVQAALSSITVHPYFHTGAAWADPDSVSMRRPARPEPNARLHATGNNLAAALSSMRDERSEDWQDFLLIVRRAFPRMKELRLPAVSRGMVQLLWVDDKGNSFDASELSDGTLGFLATLCALFQPGNTLVAIDEPEAHLHPDALMRLVGAARSLSERQPILLTTQSDTLIGLLDDTPESVVVAQREDNEARLVRPGPEDLREWLKTFSLRDIRRELEEWRPVS
ncbi:AAA family ATPase [Archangium sp.]|uniref:AAA family ATPase n=1 Tax=Archangium sp. TaxID=1872627 RepID=UPI002D5551CC|nr:AAA family ATPase [Archangium sp.]HYO58491.1 AAA family ATPase [Archangium sp.]